MPKSYDVIVIGVGAMGSAALYHLAGRRRKVLGLDRFEIPNEMGSSHGLTRIIRLAYNEHPSYVPLLIRAYALWRELEQRAGEKLLHITGSIDAGPPDSTVFRGAQLSCELHNLRHEILTSAELTRRFPAYRPPVDTMALYQPQGGFLLPERCIQAHVALARSEGAEVHASEPVLGWEPLPAGVAVSTASDTYRAERLIVAAGAWVADLVPALRRLAVPERQVVAWFQPSARALFAPERFPVFNLAVEEGRYYGFPEFGVPGFKIGRYHHRCETIDPSRMSRLCQLEDEQILRQCVERYFPYASGAVLSMVPCIFTNTPDEHFILDAHPDFPQVLLCSPCSGHGFKFASVIGEIMADLAETGQTRYDISMHRLARLYQDRGVFR